MKSEFPDGQLRIGRQSYEGAGTILQKPDSDEWIRRQPATLFPLLVDVSRIGDVSPFLTRAWDDAKTMLVADESLRSLI